MLPLLCLLALLLKLAPLSTIRAVLLVALQAVLLHWRPANRAFNHALLNRPPVASSLRCSCSLRRLWRLRCLCCCHRRLSSPWCLCCSLRRLWSPGCLCCTLRRLWRLRRLFVLLGLVGVRAAELHCVLGLQLALRLLGLLCHHDILISIFLCSPGPRARVSSFHSLRRSHEGSSGFSRRRRNRRRRKVSGCRGSAVVVVERRWHPPAVRAVRGYFFGGFEIITVSCSRQQLLPDTAMFSYRATRLRAALFCILQLWLAARSRSQSLRVAWFASCSSG